jgi:hypothetical protein
MPVDKTGYLKHLLEHHHVTLDDIGEMIGGYKCES